MAVLKLWSIALLIVSTGAFAPVHKPDAVRSGKDVYRFAKKPWWKIWGSPQDSSDSGASSDITSTPAFLKKKLEVLQKEKAKLDADLDAVHAETAAANEEWGELKTKLNAEFIFLQERTFNETRDSEVMARVEVVKELLPIIDNFERARANLRAADAGQEAILAYYNGVLDKVDSVLESFKLETIPTVGEEFDYNLHEAIMQEPSEEYGEDIVCAEMQKGYKIGDQVIRAAVVTVSIGPGP